MPDDWPMYLLIAAASSLIAWHLGRAALRREQRRWYAPPPVAVSPRLLTDEPARNTAPPPVTAALARHVQGEIVIALVDFQRDTVPKK